MARTRQAPRTTYSFPESFLALSTRTPQYEPITDELLPHQIITIPKLIDVKTCNDLIRSFQTSLNFETTPLVKKSKEYAARLNDRAMVYDPKLSRLLFEYLYRVLNYQNPYEEEEDNTEFKDCIGLNPNLRIYKYSLDEHHFFAKHYDDAVKVDLEQGDRGITKWTLLIYLSGDFIGGDTVFYTEDGRTIRVHPNQGMALLHKHGDDCLLHELEPLQNGIKWVLRSDLVYNIDSKVIKVL